VIDVNVPRPRRSRILAPEEYRALWLAIDALRYQGTVKRVSLWAIQFLVLTPLRKTEVFRLRWEHVDRDRGIIQVHEHKTDHFEEPLELFITEPLGHLLDSMSMSSPWLFPSPESETGHISGVDRAWVTVRKESGLFEGHKRITLHDLRRSWTSVGAALGYGPEFMGKVIGNSARVNEEHYWHLQESLKREISTRIAASIVSFGLNATK
jgi:integrase